MDEILAKQLAEEVSEQLECKNKEKVKDDILDLCEDQDLCSDKKIIPSEAIPSGSWSAAGLACLHITGNIEFLAVQKKDRWKCKKYVLNNEQLDRKCSTL
jgi:hypothetical protein